MTTSPKRLWFDEDSMWVELHDARILGVPLAWFPRLLDSTPEQRMNYELSAFGIHWDSLDEDISIEGLLAGNGDMTTMPRKVAWQAETVTMPVRRFFGAAFSFAIQQQVWGEEMMQASDNQKNAIINSITEAGVKAYCESYGIPTEVLESAVGIDLYLVKRQAKAMTTELDRIIMTHVGPQLLRFWSHQGCPELPPLQK